ncbi:hypothetical protein Tco_0775514 [Tanacetum coccineum]
MANLKYIDKHNMVAFLKKPNESVGFTEVVDFLKDATGIHNLSDAEIYAGLATLGYVTEGDIVPLLPAMLAGAAVDQGEGSAQPAEPHHTPVDPISSTSQPPIPSPPHPSPLPHSPYQSPPHSPLHHSPYQSPPHSPHHSHNLIFHRPRSYKPPPSPEGVKGKERLQLVEEDIQATHKTKEQLRQEEAGLENAIKLQAQLDERKATKAKLKRYGEELQTKTSKKQRIDDKDVPVIGEKVAEVKEEEQVKRTGKRKKQKARKGINVDKSAQEDSETDKEESVEAMNPTPLDYKNLIYMSFGAMIKDFTREDLIELYRLVMQKYGTNRPEDAYDRVLWSDLRTMFDPPLIEDAIWSLPLQQKMIESKPLSKEACQMNAENKLSRWKNE